MELDKWVQKQLANISTFNKVFFYKGSVCECLLVDFDILSWSLQQDFALFG